MALIREGSILARGVNSGAILTQEDGEGHEASETNGNL